MKLKVFISYSRADSAFALRLVQDLKQRGIATWFDQIDIPPGVNWDTEIEAALSAANMMLVVLSNSSVGSDNVKNEISHALEQKKQVIPIMLGAKSVPLIITRLQREDFTGPYEAAFEKLALRLSAAGRTESLEAITRTHTAPARATTAVSPPAESLAPLSSSLIAALPRRSALYLAGGSALALAGLIAFLRGGHEATSPAQDTAAPSISEPTQMNAGLEVSPVLIDSNRWFKLKSMFQGTGKCLESNVFDAAADHGGHSHMATCDQVSGQRWKFVRHGDWYQLKSEFQGEGGCLESNNPDAGGAAYMDTCANVTGQFWKVVVQDDGTYRLKSEFQGEGRCLESNDPTSNHFHGAAYMDTCADVSGQLWSLIPD